MSFSDRKIFIYLSFLVISILYLGVFSASTSPLFIGYGGDSSIFLMLGKMLLAGKTPYVDFFDHKGPMLIFIEALGQLIIPDRIGLFILQIINLTVTLIFIFKIANLFANRIFSFCTVILSLLFFSFTIERGNLSEEYSLPFLTFILYLTCKFWLSGQKRKISLYAFAIGLCTGMLLWIRLNNMGAACACSLFIFIIILKNKDWNSLLKYISFYIIGVLCVSIPILIYFYTIGAMEDMVFASFLYNFQYIGVNESDSPFSSLVSTFYYILKGWIPFMVLLIGTIVYYLSEKKNDIIVFSILLLFFGYITTHLGSAFYHYMTLNISCLVLGLAYIFYPLSNLKNKRIYSYIFTGMASLLLISYAVYKYKDAGGGTKGDSYYISQAKDIVSHIPLEERDSIYAYQIYSRFYASADVLPCYKYFIMQEWQGKFNKQVLIEINTKIETDPPLWVVTQFRDMSTNDRFWEIMDEKYNLESKNHLFELYKLK